MDLTREKTLYSIFNDKDLIREEMYMIPPRRTEKRLSGYIWEGELKVILKSGLKCIFSFRHHFYEDRNDGWRPRHCVLSLLWVPKFVPRSSLPPIRYVDASWHMIRVNDNFYISKIGMFYGVRDKEILINSIQNGSWKHDNDIWCLI